MKRDPKRVAIIEPVGGHGGMNFYDIALGQALADSGVDPTLYTCDVTVEDCNSYSWRIVKSFVGIWGGGSKIIRAQRYVWCLMKSLVDARRNGIGLVHYHFFHSTFLELMCLVVAKCFGMRVVATVHDVESFAGSGSLVLGKVIFRGCDRLIAHNEVSKSEIVRKFNLRESFISIIPHGNYVAFDTEQLDRVSARRVLGLPSDKKIVLFFGQIKSVKGLDLLLESLPEIVELVPNVLLVVAGKVWKDDFERYKRIIDSNGLEPYVRLDIGYVTDIDAFRYMRACDVVSLPYRRIYQSGVLLMAMSCKAVTVVSDLPGMREIVEDGVTGFVHDVESPLSISRQLVRAMADDSGLRDVAAHAFDYVATHHSWLLVGKLTAAEYARAAQ